MALLPEWIMEADISDGSKILFGYFHTVQRLGYTNYPGIKKLIVYTRKPERTIRRYQKELEDGGWLLLVRGGTNAPKKFLVADVRGKPYIPETEAFKDKGRWSELTKPNSIESEPIKNSTKHSLAKDIDVSIATATPSSDDSYSYAQEVEKLLLNPRRDLQIVGMYFLRKNLLLENRKQFNNELRRNLRVANRLSGYGDNRLHKAMTELEKHGKEVGYSFTLETVEKRIAEIT